MVWTKPCKRNHHETQSLYQLQDVTLRWLTKIQFLGNHSTNLRLYLFVFFPPTCLFCFNTFVFFLLLIIPDVFTVVSCILSSIIFFCAKQVKNFLFPLVKYTVHSPCQLVPGWYQYPSYFFPCTGSYFILEEVSPVICAAELQQNMSWLPVTTLPENALSIYRRLPSSHESSLKLLKSPTGLPGE